MQNKKKYYEQTNLQLDISKSKQKLKWKPKLTIKQCLKLTVSWYRKVIKNNKVVSKIYEEKILNFMKK